ncbi:MAG TPA: glycine--tRNA ligase subunit beta, partial [Vicinamibacteria bacterium]|nr:glycine--tRNA ligase subunit beta [Vicinamibacteria bacterium]
KVDKELEALTLARRKVESYATTRRLVVHVPGIAEKQDDRKEQVIGPPLNRARDESGNWSMAALGFARKNGLAARRLATVQTSKGEYVGFERTIRGRKTKDLLPGIMSSVLRSLNFPKSMSWDATLPDGAPLPFGRPIRWMVAIYGDRVIPFEIRIAGAPPVKAGNKTRGHRFLAPRRAKPGVPFVVSSFAELKKDLLKHYVVLDAEQRAERLEKELTKLEKKAKARRAGGLDAKTVADMVEWPGAVLGHYPSELLALPEEVRHTVLIHHQHYFPLDGRASFIAVTNMASDLSGHIRRGAERVVLARLRDAKFFWEDDLEAGLEQRLPSLEGVLFHPKLGSYRDKTERVTRLSLSVAERCGARESPVRRAATLAKCDLTTGMVGEFPELQGIVGGLYAREQGEPEAVWKAIYSHYRPLGLATDDLFPLNREGAVVALADKLDTLAGLFSAGVVPRGSSDPFGLRRAALGAIRILLESQDRVGIEVAMAPSELLREALIGVREQSAKVDGEAETNLSDFFAERLRFVFARRYRYDEVNAVFALGVLERPVQEVEKRLEALAASRGSEDFAALSTAFKRVGNILSDRLVGEVDESLLSEKAEKELFLAVEGISPRTRAHLDALRYEEALAELSKLRPEVDRFFDEVLVMAEEQQLRENRLALLKRLQRLFSEVADLSEIVPTERAS